MSACTVKPTNVYLLQTRVGVQENAIFSISCRQAIVNQNNRTGSKTDLKSIVRKACEWCVNGVYVCVCMCVRTCERACIRACMRAYVCECRIVCVTESHGGINNIIYTWSASAKLAIIFPGFSFATGLVLRTHQRFFCLGFFC